jgi:hypothetical protein
MFSAPARGRGRHLFDSRTGHILTEALQRIAAYRFSFYIEL